MVATATCDSGLTPDLQSFVEEHGRTAKRTGLWSSQDSLYGLRHIKLNRNNSNIFKSNFEAEVTRAQGNRVDLYSQPD